MSDKIEYSRLLIKRSDISGVTPTITSATTLSNFTETDLFSGEMFLNTVDETAYVRLGNTLKQFDLITSGGTEDLPFLPLTGGTMTGNITMDGTTFMVGSGVGNYLQLESSLTDGLSLKTANGDGLEVRETGGFASQYLALTANSDVMGLVMNTTDTFLYGGDGVTQSSLTLTPTEAVLSADTTIGGDLTILTSKSIKTTNGSGEISLDTDGFLDTMYMGVSGVTQQDFLKIDPNGNLGTGIGTELLSTDFTDTASLNVLPNFMNMYIRDAGENLISDITMSTSVGKSGSESSIFLGGNDGVGNVWSIGGNTAGLGGVSRISFSAKEYFFETDPDRDIVFSNGLNMDCQFDSQTVNMFNGTPNNTTINIGKPSHTISLSADTTVTGDLTMGTSKVINSSNGTGELELDWDGNADTIKLGVVTTNQSDWIHIDPLGNTPDFGSGMFSNDFRDDTGMVEVGPSTVTLTSEDTTGSIFAKIQTSKLQLQDRGRIFLSAKNSGTTQTSIEIDTNLGSTGSEITLISDKIAFNGVTTFTEYTVLGVPTASSYQGGMIMVTDETGGYTPAFSDGTNWRRTSDRAIVS